MFVYNYLGMFVYNYLGMFVYNYLGMFVYNSDKECMYWIIISC